MNERTREKLQQTLLKHADGRLAAEEEASLRRLLAEDEDARAYARSFGAWENALRGELKAWLDRYPAAPQPGANIFGPRSANMTFRKWAAWTTAAVLLLFLAVRLWPEAQLPPPTVEPVASGLTTVTRTIRATELPDPTFTTAAEIVSPTAPKPDVEVTQPAATATLAATAQPVATLSPISSDRPLLFARQGALWRAGLDGRDEERLTADGVYKWLLDPIFLMDLLVGHPELYHPVASPDGRYLVWGETNSGSLRLLDLATGEIGWLPTPSSPPAVWSADGRFLAYSDHRFRRNAGDDLYLYDMVTGEVSQVLSLPQDEHSFGLMNLVWSPDNSEIAFTCCFQAPPRGGLVGKMARLQLDSGTFTTGEQIEATIGVPPSPICWSADNQVVSRRASDDSSYCSAVSPNFPAVSPDGLMRVRSFSRLIAGTPEFWLGVESTEGILLWERRMPGDMSFNRVYWSADGNMLYLDDPLATSPIWRIPADGSGDWEMIVEEGYLLGIVAAWQ